MAAVSPFAGAENDEWVGDDGVQSGPADSVTPPTDDQKRIAACVAFRQLLGKARAAGGDEPVQMDPKVVMAASSMSGLPAHDFEAWLAHPAEPSIEAALAAAAQRATDEAALSELSAERVDFVRAARARYRLPSLVATVKLLRDAEAQGTAAEGLAFEFRVAVACMLQFRVTNAPAANCNGLYVLTGHRTNGRPVWEMPGKDRTLYLCGKGKWRFSDMEDALSGASQGYIDLPGHSNAAGPSELSVVGWTRKSKVAKDMQLSPEPPAEPSEEAVRQAALAAFHTLRRAHAEAAEGGTAGGGGDDGFTDLWTADERRAVATASVLTGISYTDLAVWARHSECETLEQANQIERELAGVSPERLAHLQVLASDHDLPSVLVAKRAHDAAVAENTPTSDAGLIFRFNVLKTLAFRVTGGVAASCCCEYRFVEPGRTINGKHVWSAVGESDRHLFLGADQSWYFSDQDDMSKGASSGYIEIEGHADRAGPLELDTRRWQKNSKIDPAVRLLPSADITPLLVDRATVAQATRIAFSPLRRWPWDAGDVDQARTAAAMAQIPFEDLENWARFPDCESLEHACATARIVADSPQSVVDELNAIRAAHPEVRTLMAAYSLRGLLEDAGLPTDPAAPAFAFAMKAARAASCRVLGSKKAVNNGVFIITEAQSAGRPVWCCSETNRGFCLASNSKCALKPPGRPLPPLTSPHRWYCAPIKKAMSGTAMGGSMRLENAALAASPMTADGKWECSAPDDAWEKDKDAKVRAAFYDMAELSPAARTAAVLTAFRELRSSYERNFSTWTESESAEVHAAAGLAGFTFDDLEDLAGRPTCNTVEEALTIKVTPPSLRVGAERTRQLTVLPGQGATRGGAAVRDLTRAARGADDDSGQVWTQLSCRSRSAVLRRRGRWLQPQRQPRPGLSSGGA